MTKRGEVYKCTACGSMVEVIQAGAGEISCCGRPMQRLEEKTADSSVEKHVPFIRKEGDRYIIKVGENAEHPMESGHYIQWIEVLSEDTIMRRYLKPAGKPQAEFAAEGGGDIIVREHCNLHGLWLARG